MPEQVNIPLLGSTNKATVIAGSFAVAAMGGYVLYKYEKDKKSAATKAAAASTTPGAQASGYGYNSAGYGYGAGYLGYGFGYSTPGSVGEVPSEWEYGYGEYGYGYYNTATGAYEGPASGSGAPSTATPTTNAEWGTVATSDLVGQGYNSQSVTAALGAYLAGATLTADQVTIVQAALALTGNPPVAGTNGYPPAYHQNASTGQTTPSGSNVTVPNVVGKRQQDAVQTLEAAGLKSHTGTGFIQNQVNIVGSQTPGAGKSVPSGSTVDIGGFTH
jgi:PASTA domain